MLDKFYKLNDMLNDKEISNWILDVYNQVSSCNTKIVALLVALFIVLATTTDKFVPSSVANPIFFKLMTYFYGVGLFCLVLYFIYVLLHFFRPNLGWLVLFNFFLFLELLITGFVILTLVLFFMVPTHWQNVHLSFLVITKFYNPTFILILILYPVLRLGSFLIKLFFWLKGLFFRCFPKL